jgi:DNA-directed RNA polymerase specialized sigma24 family protein
MGKRRGGRPSLPDSVAGLLDACRRSRGAGDAPLREWIAANAPALEGALRGWGRNRNDARALVDRLVEEAFLAARKRMVVSREVPWMSGILMNLWLAMLRERKKEKEKEKEKRWVAPESFADPGPDPLERLLSREDHGRRVDDVLRVARRLPRPYGHALWWRLGEGMTPVTLRLLLNSHRPAVLPPVGDRQVRRILAAAMEMASAALEGRDPRTTHPQRFLLRKNPWIASALPPLPTQIR